MTTIKFRRDTSVNWTSVNPIPAQGEPCYETDTGKLKIGNGSDNYMALPYVSDGGGSSGDLPIATATTIGGIKVGDNLSITEDGTLSANDGVAINDTTASTTTTYSSSKIEKRLANKVDINSKVIDGQWVSETKTLSTATEVGTYTIDLSSYLPNDNYNYEVIMGVNYTVEDVTDSLVSITTSIISDIPIARGNKAAVKARYTQIIPTGFDKIATLRIESHSMRNFSLTALGYRRIGTNK